MNLTIVEYRLTPGELPIIQGSPDTVVWRPRSGWRPANKEREVVWLQEANRKKPLRQWLDQRIPSYPEWWPSRPLVFLMIRCVELEWVHFGVALVNPHGVEAQAGAPVSRGLMRHLGRA